MPINRLLKHSLMGPEEVRRLNLAYETALRALYLVDRDDPITEIVGRKIIEISQAGLRDPLQISARALKELGTP